MADNLREKGKKEKAAQATAKNKAGVAAAAAGSAKSVASGMHDDSRKDGKKEKAEEATDDSRKDGKKENAEEATAKKKAGKGVAGDASMVGSSGWGVSHSLVTGCHMRACIIEPCKN